MKLRLSLLSLCLGAFALTASADEIRFSGNTLGCFGAGCTPVATASLNPDITFFSATFDDQTVFQTLAFGGNAMNSTANFNNFGSLRVNAPVTGTDTYSSPFTLQITFTRPTGISGGQTQTYVATLNGALNSTSGGISVDFSTAVNNFTAYTFTANQNGLPGSFQIRVNDISVNGGQTGAFSGDVAGATTSAVPEPATYAMLRTGLCALAMISRRKRSA